MRNHVILRVITFVTAAATFPNAAPLAAAMERYVSTEGADATNDCLSASSPCRTIGHALSQAASGDTIKTSRGKFEEILILDYPTTLTLSGGWSSDFSERDVSVARTTLDGAAEFTVVQVTAGLGTAIDLTLDGFTIAKGLAFGLAATVSGDGSLTLDVRNSTFTKNATYGGGALALTAGGSSSVDVSLANVVIKRNGGGAFHVNAWEAASVTMTATNCVATRNRQGGITFQHASSSPMNVTLENCRILRNRAQTFPSYVSGGIGAVAFGSGGMNLSVVNSTIARNRSTGDVGGGVHLYSVSSLTAVVTNTILWRNKVAHGAASDLDMDAAGALVVNADHDDIGQRITLAGTYNDLGGNVSEDPLLRGDGHLKVGSPVIDTGTCTGIPVSDIDGDPRPSGSGCDIGADEFVP